MTSLFAMDVTTALAEVVSGWGWLCSSGVVGWARFKVRRGCDRAGSKIGGSDDTGTCKEHREVPVLF